MRWNILFPIVLVLAIFIASCGADLGARREWAARCPRRNWATATARCIRQHRVRLVHKALMGRPEIPLCVGLSCALTSDEACADNMKTL